MSKRARVGLNQESAPVTLSSTTFKRGCSRSFCLAGEEANVLLRDIFLNDCGSKDVDSVEVIDAKSLAKKLIYKTLQHSAETWRSP